MEKIRRFQQLCDAHMYISITSASTCKASCIDINFHFIAIIEDDDVVDVDYEQCKYDSLRELCYVSEN